MEKIEVEMELLPATNKLVGLAQLLDCGADNTGQMDESGFIGLSAILLSIVDEISHISYELNKRIADQVKGVA